MRLYEIIHIGEIGTDKGYAITNKIIKLEDKKNFVNNFFGKTIANENDDVMYITHLESIAKKGNIFVADHGECFIEHGKIFTKYNKTLEELKYNVKDMTKDY